MERHILIAGRSSPVADALRTAALSLHLKSLVTTSPDQESSPATEVSGELQDFTLWNMRSPLSARSVIIRAVNVLDTIDEALIVFSSADRYRPYHEIAASEIESSVDADIKGYLFVVREVLSHFHRQRKGVITFVMHRTDSDQAVAPIVASSYAAFRELAASLFVMYQNEPLILRGYLCGTDQLQDFARYILTTASDHPERTRGKWIRYTGRGGFFSRLTAGSN